MKSCTNNRAQRGPTDGLNTKRTMKKILLLLIAIFGCSAGSVYAADIVQSERDCAEILEQWADDPNSVPQHLVDECKERMGAVAAANDVPDVIPFAGGQQAADPCVGDGAAGSVHCWGPWSALAPAAAGNALPSDLAPVDELDLRPELLTIDPIVQSCIPGSPCGFATVIDGLTGQGPADETSIEAFDLAIDGSQFTVAPGEAGQIASVGGMTPVFSGRPDGFENMRSNGADGDLRSRLIARVTRDTNGNIIEAADSWGDGNAATGLAQSGFFAWGVSMPQADLDVLNNGAVSAVFSGPMSVDNGTTATITVNFGADASWTGDWTNPGYTFDAGGTLVGVDLVSDPTQFSSNVGADSAVQGVLLGQSNDKSIAHVIDVDIDGTGRVKDVGLIRE